MVHRRTLQRRTSPFRAIRKLLKVKGNSLPLCAAYNASRKNSTILAKTDRFLTPYILTTMRHNSGDNRLWEGTKMMKTERAKMNATEKKGSLSAKLCLPNLLLVSPHPFRH